MHTIIENIPSPRLEPVLKAKRSQPPALEGRFEYADPPADFNRILELSLSNAYHWRCIDLISDAAVGVGYETDGKARAFLEEISQGEPFLDLLKRFAVDLEWSGNAYLEVARDARGRVAELYNVHAQTMWITPDEAGSRPGGYVQNIAGAPVAFSPLGRPRGGRNEMLHARTFTPLSTFYGLPRWIAVLDTLRLDQEKKTFLSSFFHNSAVPDLAVVLEGAEFDKATEEALRRALTEMKGANNAHRTLLLSIPFDNAKIRFEKLTADLKDLHFKELSEATDSEIIAAHGVPPRLVGMMTPGQLGGGGEVTGQLELFMETVIKPRMRFLEGQVQRLLRAADIGGEFKLTPIDVGALTAEDEAGNWSVSQKILKSLEAQLS